MRHRLPSPRKPDTRARVGRRQHEAGEERAELGVARRHRIEAHLVHDVLQRDRVVGEQRDAPLPVVEPGRAGDELQDAARVGAADARVAGHQLLALLERELVPVRVRRRGASTSGRSSSSCFARQLRMQAVLAVVRHALAPRREALVELVAGEALLALEPRPLVVLGRACTPTPR